jgi:hypothetical protein
MSPGSFLWRCSQLLSQCAEKNGYTRSYLPAAAFASRCFSFAIVAAVESFRLPDLWRRFGSGSV